MPDSFTEYETTGWGSRLMNSIGGVLIGVLLFIVSFPLLFWNEGRAVHRAQDLAEGAANVVNIADPSKVDAAADGKLVHLTAKAETAEVLKDDRFGISRNALQLVRDVEMYQWTEKVTRTTEKQVGGKTQTKTEYKYEKTWSPEWIDSSKFHDTEGHKNPSSMPFKSDTWRAGDIKVGAYRLSGSLARQLSGAEAIPLTDADVAKAAPELRSKLKVRNGGFYLPAESGSYGNDAEVGDVRVNFQFIKSGVEVSLVSRLNKDTFEPYTGSSGSSIDVLKMGSQSAQAMFKQMEAENNMMTWILRLVGFILMAVGIGLCFQPLVVLFDVLPFLGNFVGAGVFLFAVGVALPLSLITISIGWIAYRPLVGIPLAALGVLGLVGLYMLGRSRRAAKGK